MFIRPASRLCQFLILNSEFRIPRRYAAGRQAGFVGALGTALLTTFLFSNALAQSPNAPTANPSIGDRLAQYASIDLTPDLSKLSPSEIDMLPLLIEAAKAMDECFWIQAYGDKQKLFDQCGDLATYDYARINYGPWDRLHDDAPFLTGTGKAGLPVGPKPAGANFYPPDMTKSEFEQYIVAHPNKAKPLKHLFTMVRRGSDGKSLRAIPYHSFFHEQVSTAARRLLEAAQLAEDPGLKRYLELRADALFTDDYRASDIAWLDMKDNGIDIVIGPIETYEDKLFGYKASYEAYVLIKDKRWSKRLTKYAALLPQLQKDLPVDAAYKTEKPGSDSDLNVYDVVYYAGDCNAGAKTIAINLPNDVSVQLEKGARRLQLKNAMRAKYDHILQPITKVLIDYKQRKHITFNAFFDNTMFHEIAHGLGIKNTINGKGTVRSALKNLASAMEEGKADVLGLYMISRLAEQGMIHESNVKNSYVTFLAGIFRSVRFGAASAHGRANMIRFNFFKEAGAFSRDEKTGLYSVDFDKMKAAISALSRKILTLQGDGNHEGVKEMMERLGSIGPVLAADLDRINQADIPIDIIFQQGMSQLGG